jgi:hypothetical protein
VRSLHMGSPLDFVASIPSEYWTGGGFVLFLTAVEAKFNFVSRIRTERAQLAAQRAQAGADEREAQVRDVRAQRALEELQRRDELAEELHEEVAGLADPKAPFQLESGTLDIEDDEKPGLPQGPMAHRD